MSRKSRLNQNCDNSAEDLYEESPSRFFKNSIAIPDEANLDRELQRALEFSSEWESSERETSVSDRDVFTNMASWIENVAKPALETQDTLWAQLRAKDNEWRRAQLDLQFLKDQNKDLQESLNNRPTNEQHESERTRAANLESEIEKVEKVLEQKEQTLFNITKKVRNMIRNQKELENTRDDLSIKLHQITEEFTSKLKSVTRKNLRLEKKLLQRETDINSLRNVVRKTEKMHLERLQNNVKYQFNQSNSTSRSPLWTPRSASCYSESTPHPHVEEVEATEGMFPKDVILKTPASVRSSTSLRECLGELSVRSLCNSVSTVAISGCSLTTFLDTITNLSKQFQRADSENCLDAEIEGTLSTFQTEIQKCIENWEHMEVPREDILKLIERIFEEWSNEKTMRLKLEEDLENMKCQHHGIIRRICGDIVDIHQSRTPSPSKTFAVLWVPVRVTGWLIYVPIKLGSLSLSTNIYLAKKTFSILRSMLGVVTKAKGKLKEVALLQTLGNQFTETPKI